MLYVLEKMFKCNCSLNFFFLFFVTPNNIFNQSVRDNLFYFHNEILKWAFEKMRVLRV